MVSVPPPKPWWKSAWVQTALVLACALIGLIILIVRRYLAQ